MSKFTEGLSIKEYKVDSDRWSLLSDLVWGVGDEASVDKIIVPTGTVSDGASIPWPINIVFPRWGRRYRRPAVLHDFLYNLGRARTPHAFALKRKAADTIFREAMKACGVSLPIRTLFYLAVRLGARPWPGESYFKRLDVF